jgi:hypothetical protein
MIIGQLNQNPVITAELKNEVNLTNLNFMSDAQLKEWLGSTSATSEQLDEALRINAEARIRAVKIGFLCLSGLACWRSSPAGCRITSLATSRVNSRIRRSADSGSPGWKQWMETAYR